MPKSSKKNKRKRSLSASRNRQVQQQLPSSAISISKNESCLMSAPTTSKDESYFMSAPSTSKDESCLFNAEPSKEFISSALSVSPILKMTSSPKGKSGKISFRKLSVPCSPIIPLNDDASELCEDEEAKGKSLLNKTSDKSGIKEEEISTTRAISEDQMREHIECCLQLSTENKITTKNAFALQLIDFISKVLKEDEDNFATMACQLDASVMIYSHRVDAVHQQVKALAESWMMLGMREPNSDNGDEGLADNPGERDGKIKKKNVKKKSFIAKDEDIRRLPKPSDPRDRYMRVGALPGEILNNARYDANLALTLERDLPFWPAPSESYKPLRCEGDFTIEPDLYRSAIKHRSLGPIINIEPTKTETDIAPSPASSDNFEIEYEDFDNEGVAGAGEQESTPVEAADKDLEIINIARARMMAEGAGNLKRHEVINAIFHKPNESEYHYLKIDNSRYWAGPEYWKRAHVGGTSTEPVANKKSIVRKKKEPANLDFFTSPDKTKVANSWKPVFTDDQKRIVLRTRTTAKWDKKNVTLPPDIQFDPSVFFKIFKMDSTPEIMHANTRSRTNSGVEDEDLFDEINHDDSVGAAMPLEQEAGPVAESQDKLTQEVEMHIPYKSLGSSRSEELKRDGDGEAYEGENLVSMVKTVKVDPIKFKAKPNRVDMHHLKDVMLSLIKEPCSKENSEDGKEKGITFLDLLKKLHRSPLLQHRTREDLSVAMAFLALLTLTNEHRFRHVNENGESGDFTIYLPNE